MTLIGVNRKTLSSPFLKSKSAPPVFQSLGPVTTMVSNEFGFVD